jgi:CheY-like chemotaxis protein
VSDLAALVLGQRSTAAVPSRAMTGLVIRTSSGELQVGMLPDVFEMRTVITKDFGPYMRSFPGTRGATILGSGDVAPVIDARELIRSVSAYQPWSMRDEQYRQELAKVVRKRVIVADDSLSVRRSLSQLLSDAGFQVELARDGLEALTLAKSSLPDIMLIDLEMPRMNGLELASHLRFQEGVTHMPILMITSRAGAKHLQTASESGINEVIAKPYQDDALLSMIATYLSKAEELVS